MTTVFLAGGFGKMGIAIQTMLAETADLTLGGILAHTPHPSDVPVFTNRADITINADVWVDVTVPEVAFDNGVYALTHGFDLVMGTSGLQESQISQLQQLAEAHQRHAIIVPNFSISAVLLMQFSAQAAKYMPDVEIVEIHNPKKLDAPSGTAKATAALINAQRGHYQATPLHAPARGDLIAQVPVHAMRLPGYVAEQEVIFGATGETLRIKQTSFTRESFMGGVALAIRNVTQVNGLVVGLEHLL